MSTTTTFKRISLVAVAALGFGVLSVAPSSAAASAGTITVTDGYDEFGGSSSTGSGSAVIAFTASASADAVAVTATITDSPALSTATVEFGAGSSLGANTDSSVVSGDDNNIVTPTSDAAGAVTATHAVTVTANKAGVYTVTLTPNAAGISAGMTAKSLKVYLSALYGYTADGLATGNASKSAINGVAGPANSVGLKVAEQGTTPRLVTVEGAGATIASLTASHGTVATNALSATVIAGTSAVVNDLVVNTPTVGTITVNVYDQASAGIYKTTPTSTVTITVSAASVIGTVSAANSTSVIDSTTGTTFGGQTTDEVLTVAGTGLGTRVATIKVTLKDTQAVPAVIASKTISASVTGPGLIQAAPGTGANTLIRSTER
jgi:hypothetical protein